MPVIEHPPVHSFGEVYGYNTATTETITGSGIANRVQVTAFDTNGEASGDVTPDHTNDHLTVSRAGRYFASLSIVIESGAGSAFEAGLGVFSYNGATLFENLHAHRSLAGGGGDVGHAGASGIINIASLDTIEVWIWNETNTVNIIVDDITLSLQRLGD